MKKFFAILLTIALLLSLTACGKEDPNAGKYIGIKGEMMGMTLTMEELYPGESYLELKSGGKATLVLEGDKVSGKWTLDGEDFNLVVEGEDCPGTLKDGVVVFDFAGSGIMLTFAKDGAEVPSGSSNDQAEPDANPEANPEATPEASGPLGLYQGTTYEYSGQKFEMTTAYDGECTLELLDGGKCILNLGGEKMDCTWTLDGEELVVDNIAAKSTGTLKDGTATIDFMGMGMMLTFVKGDGAAAGGEGAAASDIAGTYLLYAVDQDGEYAGNDIITELGMARDNYIILNEDGTALVVMEQEEIPCTYNESYLIDEDGFENSYAFVDGLLELYLDGNVTFYFEKGDLDALPENEPQAGGAFPDYVAEEFYGDWHGWCLVMDASGAYVDEIDNEFELLARYAFDENGNCTPWMAIYSDSESNFRNIVLTYDEADGFAYLSGELFGMTILPESYMYDTFGSLSLTLYLEDDEGTVDIIVCMRHPDDAWDEYDYPCMPEDALSFYAGMSFEELVELYELDPADLPALS